MFMIKKRNVYTILGCLLILTIAFEVKNASINKKNAVETVALPVNNKVIVLDAGHGNPDGGATTADRNF